MSDTDLKKAIIFAEPGTLVSDGLVPTAINYINQHSNLTLQSFVDVSKNSSYSSYFHDLTKRAHPKHIGRILLRRLSGRPTHNYPNCRAWVNALHTPNIRIMEAPDPNSDEFLRYIRDTNPDLILLLGCSHILENSYFEISELDIINYHWSYLPEYPGRYVTFWAPYNQEDEHGVTFHTISREVDQGMAIVQRRVPIRSGGPTLAYDCLAVGRKLLPEVLDRVAVGDLEATTEIEEGDIYYAHKFENNNFGFDVSSSPKEIERRVNAQESVRTSIENKTVVVTNFESTDNQTFADNGRILSVSRNGLAVATDGKIGRITSLYYLPAWVIARILGIHQGDKIDSS